ncbi:MAG: hypothetical protein ACOC56_04625 [Atribacterota bacterium]
MLKYDIFGSEDSQDYDVMVYVNKIPNTNECRKLTKKYNKKLSSILTNKKVDVNLAVLKNGIIIDVYKGTPDECNNSVFRTAKNPYVTKIVPRNVTLKVARALRIMLSFLSRTEHRPQIKKALKSKTQIKIDTLLEINFQYIKNLNKNNQNLQDFYKQAAFQLIQVAGLIDYTEIYSKKEAAVFNPSLKKCLYRKASNYDIIALNNYKNHILKEILSVFNIEKIKE